MTDLKAVKREHPTEREISDYLDHITLGEAKRRIEDHIACCPECLTAVVCAYDSVKMFKKGDKNIKGRTKLMKKINLYLMLAVVSFLLSFAVPRYFAQFLVAATLLGIKWISDSKSTRMLVMIYDAWKNGGEKEASRVLSSLEPVHKDRF